MSGQYMTAHQVKRYLEMQQEIKQLREQLKEANDVIQYALEMSSDDDSTRVFEDLLRGD
jgi:hypothetical protein